MLARGRQNNAIPPLGCGPPSPPSYFLSPCAENLGAKHIVTLSLGQPWCTVQKPALWESLEPPSAFPTADREERPPSFHPSSGEPGFPSCKQHSVQPLSSANAWIQRKREQHEGDQVHRWGHPARQARARVPGLLPALQRGRVWYSHHWEGTLSSPLPTGPNPVWGFSPARSETLLGQAGQTSRFQRSPGSASFHGEDHYLGTSGQTYPKSSLHPYQFCPQKNGPNNHSPAGLLWKEASGERGTGRRGLSRAPECPCQLPSALPRGLHPCALSERPLFSSFF